MKLRPKGPMLVKKQRRQLPGLENQVKEIFYGIPPLPVQLSPPFHKILATSNNLHNTSSIHLLSSLQSHVTWDTAAIALSYSGMCVYMIIVCAKLLRNVYMFYVWL